MCYKVHHYPAIMGADRASKSPHVICQAPKKRGIGHA